MREKYIGALKKQLDEKIFVHSLALEACMGGLYDYFSANNLLDANEPPKDDWLLSGLVHDIDYSEPFKSDHPNKTLEALNLYGLTLPPTVHNIVKAHAPSLTGHEPHNKAEWSILCADSLTGLIMAVALVYPSRKLSDVKLSSVMKRFLKEPKFAAGTRREEVVLCESPSGLNLSLEKFVGICLESMQRNSSELGL